MGQRVCELCGRELASGYMGAICAICKQEFAVLQDQARYVREVPATPIVLTEAAATSNPGFVSQQDAGHPDLEGIVDLVRLSSLCWLIVGILQLICGLIFFGTPPAAAWFILLGAWNIGIATARNSDARRIRERDPLIPTQYEAGLAGILIVLMVNLVFGALIGIAGAVLDLVVRYRVLRQRVVFNSPETGMPRRNSGWLSGIAAILVAGIVWCGLWIIVPTGNTPAINSVPAQPAGPRYSVGDNLKLRLSGIYRYQVITLKDAEAGKPPREAVPAAHSSAVLIEIADALQANDRVGLGQLFYRPGFENRMWTFQPGTEALVLQCLEYEPIDGRAVAYIYKVRLPNRPQPLFVAEESLSP